MARLKYFQLNRLSGRVFWAFAGLAGTILLAGVVAFVLLSQADSSNQTRLNRQRQADSLNDWRTMLQDQLSTLDLALTYDLPNSLDYFQTSRTRSATVVSQVSQTFPDNDPATPAFRRLLGTYFDISNQVSSGLDSKLPPAEQTQLLNTVRTRLQQLEADSETFRAERQQLVASAAQDYSGLAANARLIYLAIAIALFFLAALLAAATARSVTQPLVNLDERLQRVADGDLSEFLELHGPVEVIELSQIFNRTIVDLQRIISLLQSQARQVRLASQQVGQLSQLQATGVADQAVAISEISTTLAELSDTSRQIADSASLVVETAHHSLEVANHSYQAMQGAGEAMQDIRQKVNEIVEAVLDLNGQAQQVQEITVLLDTLSSEMHLLALNASIESVGAGMDGDRFAVVAGHIRKLVQRSRAEAVEVQQLLQQIQRGTVGSVMTTEEGLKIVAVAEETVQGGYLANREIIAQVEQTTQLAEAISQATEQQRIVSSQVALTLHELSQLFNQLTQASDQYLTSADELTEVVIQLNSLSDMFQIRPAPPPEETTPETESEAFLVESGTNY